MGKLAKRHAEPPALVTTSLAALEAMIGGRAVLVAALSHAPKSKDVEYVLGLIGDPTQAHVSLAQLCAIGGITAGDLIEAFKAGELNRAQAVATRAIGERLAGVVEDTMKKAAPYEDACHACQGVGQVTHDPTEAVPNPGPEPCETCRGSGRLYYDGDLEHKKLALELGKMTAKGGGVNLQVNQQTNSFNFGASGGALEKLQEATDRILYGGEASPLAQTVLEAEVVDPPPTESQLDTDWRGEQA